MALNDPLSNVLSHICNSERKGKDGCIVTPASKVVLKILDIMKRYGYIGNFDIIDKRQGGFVKVNLLGDINKCGVIKPRFSFKLGNYEKYEKRYLPAKGFGIMIVTTPRGIMVHTDAIDKNIGGKLLAYCY